MSEDIRTIVVGVATLDIEDPVLRPAADLARGLGAVLCVVHAYTPDDPLLSEFSHPGQFHGAERDRLAQLRRHAAGAGPGASVRCRVVTDEPAEALRRVAMEVDADLVVVGATRRGPLARAVLGTTGSHVLRVARVPVLLLRCAPAVPHRVLLTTDFSSLSGAAHDRGVAVARALAGGAGPALRTLHVANELPLPLAGFASDPDAVTRTRLERFAEARETGAGVLETSVRGGDPASAIVAEASAWAADLIVVGSHARRGFARLLLGSVAEATMLAAGCNVLVVPPAAAAVAPAEDAPVVELTPWGV